MVVPIMCDVDGCLVPPRGAMWDFAGLAKLTEMIQRKDVVFSLCSGRPATFMEALARQLMISHYLICENGSVLFHPLTKRGIIHPDIDQDYMQMRPEIARKLEEITAGTDVIVELGKDVMFSINPIDKGQLPELLARIRETFLGSPAVIVDSGRSIEVLPKGVGKAQGLALWSELEGIPVSRILSIGDADNDLSVLQAAGYAAAPANCTDSVRGIVNYVSGQPLVQGVLDICDWAQRDLFK